jgi:hypothetical protein
MRKSCGPIITTAGVPVNAHEITGDWFVSMKFGSFGLSCWPGEDCC